MSRSSETLAGLHFFTADTTAHQLNDSVNAKMKPKN